jgi:hypothetical protein
MNKLHSVLESLEEEINTFLFSDKKENINKINELYSKIGNMLYNMGANPIIEHHLTDYSNPDKNKIAVRIELGKAICIQPEGTGCYDGPFAPILIERCCDKTTICIWSDINNEEPTHNIDINGALEINRKEN